jgi:hypothetical protein
MRSSHSLDRLDVAFDDDRLVAAGTGDILIGPPARGPGEHHPGGPPTS